MTRTALLTGVTGFIGGRLAERLLADGWTVEAAVRPSSDLADVPRAVRTRVDDGSFDGLAAIVATARPTIVFHLASLYLADHQPQQVEALIESNVAFPARLVEAMSAAGVSRLVNTGTASQHLGGPAYDPVSLYAATKQAFADLLRYYHGARGLSVVTLKLFDTYGVGDKRRKLVSLLVDAAVSGAELHMSPGDQTVDLTHIDDVVDAFVVAADRLLAADRAVEESFFVSGERFVVQDLAAHVGRVVGRPVNAVFGARPHRAREIMAPIDAGDAGLPGWARCRRLATFLPELMPDHRPADGGSA